MPKTKKTPKISYQRFTKMVQRVVGAKSHLDFLPNVYDAEKRRIHLTHARTYLGELCEEAKKVMEEMDDLLIIMHRERLARAIARPTSKKK